MLIVITGSAFEAVDVSSLMVASSSYAVSQPGTTTTTTTPPAPNVVANPGFEAALSGWGPGNGRTTLARTCTVAHTGACSAEISRSLSTGEAVLVDSPATVASSAAGATYSASAWVQAPAGRPVTLRVRELSGATVVRARTTRAMGTGGWQRLSVASWPAAGATSISVDVIASVTSSGRARVDDISLRRA